MTDTPGKLYLVPTPIGNLGDITLRALEVLKTVDVVACEDTRVSGNLLKHFEISKPLVSYHNFNEAGRAAQLMHTIAEGRSIAVITDAGSPGISDPAYRVVRAAIDRGYTVEALPGANALLPALTASGLPTDRFFFEGFLRPKSAARKRRLEALKSFPHTLVFYESPFRIAKTIADMHEVLGDRQACIAREISKKFEEYLRGPLSSLAQQTTKRNLKGEMVIVVAGASDDDTREPEENEGGDEE